MTSEKPKCTACGGGFKSRLDLESEAFQKRLLSDYDPSAFAEIQETISLIDEDYEDHASEIARLQSEITRLHSRQKQLKLCRRKLQSLLASPTQNLPNEILMYIFDLVSQYNALYGRIGFMADRQSLFLSSVCSRWRQIALSYPILWSRISLKIWSVKDIPPFRLASLARIAKCYLERSGDSLLRLEITASMTSLPLALLGQHSHRWQHLCFGDCLPRREMFSLLDNVHEFPMLEELEFDVADTRSLHEFEQAPKLRSLAIKGYAYDEPTFAPLRVSSFPFQQLTSLDIPCDADFAKVADSCPNLISLRFRLLYLESPFPTPARVLKSLRSLTFVTDKYFSLTHCLDDVLSSFSCPLLTSLVIEPASLESTWPLHALESFLMRSSCALTYLLIRGVEVSDKDLVTIFRGLSSLTSLIIKDDYPSATFTPALIQSLHSFASSPLRPPSTPPLLPKLRHLSLDYAGLIFDDEGFVDMIQSRCLLDADAQMRGIEPLRSLVLKSVHRKFDVLDRVAEIYEPLFRLEETGFMIVIEGLVREDWD